MKQLLSIVFILSLGSYAQAEFSERDDFNEVPVVENESIENEGSEETQRLSREEKKVAVEEIATEQGIDLSTSEGRKEMASYLIESGQGNLLPRRHRGPRGMGNAVSLESSSQSGEAGFSQGSGSMNRPSHTGRPRPQRPNSSSGNQGV